VRRRSTSGVVLAVLVMVCAGPPTAPAPTLTGGTTGSTGSKGPVGPASRTVPADLLDLSAWKLTLPTGKKGKPEEVLQPDLRRFADEHFRLTDTRDGVAFCAKVGGATTSGSHYPRSELREMDGTARAAWSNTAGRHVLSVRESVTALPSAKPEVVTAQIHDAEDDVLQVRLEGTELSVQYDDGAERVVLDPAYVLGSQFDIDVVAEHGKIRVFHNGVQRALIDRSGSGWYFKVGSYVQSDAEHDEPEAVGEVILHFLAVTHGEETSRNQTE
jgi:hypothetical protein